MPARGRKVRADDQQFGPCDLARFQLIAQLVDKMLWRIQILDGGDAVWQHTFAEDLRDPFAHESIALFFVTAAESSLDMNVGVNQPRHERKTGPVNYRCYSVFYRVTADPFNDPSTNEDVLMKEFTAIADNNMNVPNQKSVRLFHLRTSQVFYQCEKHNGSAKHHLYPSDQGNSQKYRHTTILPFLGLVEYFFEVFLERILRRDRHALFGIGKDEEMISRMNVKYVPGFFRNDDLSFCSYSHSPCIFPFWSFHLN